MKILFFLLPFLLIVPLHAESSLGISAMSAFSSKRVYRGAEIWPDPSMFAGVQLVLNNALFIRGPNIQWQQFPRESPYTLNIGLSYFDDSDPFIEITSHEKDFRNQRDPSLELNTEFKYKFGFRRLFSIGAQVGQEFIEYKNIFMKLMGEVPVVPYVKLGADVSVAHTKTNQYLYGPQAEGGFGYSQLSLRHVMPHLPWDGVIMHQLGYSWILRDRNKTAGFIRGRDEHLVYSIRVIWNINW